MTTREEAQRSFGDWLRQHRRALDLTQEELARLVGCSAITLRKLEAEERRPSKQIAERLADMLNIPPDDRTAFLRFARGDPFAAPAGSPAAQLSEQPKALRHNLPLQLTSFIGREKEIAEVRQLISTARLVTLTGAGGSGKTRLALEAVGGLLAHFRDGTWLVELAPLANPALVPQTVASVLGMREYPGRPLIDTLLDHLRPKRLLLVLDNCEHLIEACAELAEALLHACPMLSILATSREALDIPGEALFSVPPLASPDRSRPVSIDSLSQYDAVRLFVDRAALAWPGFRLTPDNAPAAATVCQQLDGLPLAIELAAARTRVLRVEEIADRLDNRFQLLRGGRTAATRHQTLAALMDWSYDLLSEPEQRLLQRLGVFAGGWTLAAAETLGAGGGVAAEQVLDLLTQLANKSLIIARRAQGQPARYDMLETIRQYALAKLTASGEADEVRGRHAAYYLALVETGGPEQTGVQPAWLDRMELEHDNLRAALRWCQSAPGGAGLGLRLSDLLHLFWESHGYWSEAQGWLEAALAHPGAANYPRDQAGAIGSLGNILVDQGDLEGGQAHFAHSLRLFEELGDQPRRAWTLSMLGWAARERGDAARARVKLEEALALLRELGDDSGIRGVTTTLAEAMIMQGDLVAAKALLEKNLAMARQLADTQTIGWSLNHLGHIAQLQGEYEQATRLHEQSLPVFRELGVRNVGGIHAHQGLGEAALAQGNAPLAVSHFVEALVMARDVGDREGIAWCLAGLAGAAAANEEPERAAWLFGAAEALRQSLGVREAPASHATHERLMARVREQLGEAAFAAAWAAGQAMTMEQAIAYALDEGDL